MVSVTILAAIIILGVLIFVHELGHFLVAKALGVKVERFSLGFPPKAIGKQVGETEYVLSWIPLGGYVKMFGENPDEEDAVPPEMEHRSFSHKPAWAKFLIVFAGPASNFVFAFLVFAVMFAISGVQYLSPEIGKLQQDMPAASTGLEAGDLITSIDGHPVNYFEDILERVTVNKGTPIDITVRRGDRTLTFQVTPKMVDVSNLFGETSQVPRIGIESSGETITKKINPFTALYYGVIKTYDLTKLTILSVVKMIQGKVSAKNLGGPIFIVQLTHQEASRGVVNLVFLAALLSLNLGILNLLPIPILDGGHLFFFVLEMVIRRPISINIRERAQQVGLAFIILFMAFVFYNDIARIVTGGGRVPTEVQENHTTPARNE